MKSALGLFALIFFSSAAHAGWAYEDSPDQMTGKKTVTASVASSNSLALSSPYKGENLGLLTVRKHPTYGLDVIFQVAKGQIQCSSYSACKLQVKFDDAPPIHFNGAPPEDNNSTYVFLKNTKLFLKKAATAKRILVQATFFQNGSPVLAFDTPQPLVWPPKK